MKRNRSTMLAVLSVLLFPISLYSQASTGTLSIRVVGPDKAVVTQAKITIKNEAGLTREQFTDGEGLATFLGLPPGIYAIEIEALSFKTKVQDNIEVGLSRSQVLELTMEVGSVSETVSVMTAELTEDPLEVLPNINNDLTQLALAIPGAVSANPSLLGRIVPDGKGKEQQTIRLDGLDVTPLTDLPTGDAVHSILESLLKTNVALNSGKTVTHAGAITFEPPGGAANTYGLSPQYGPGTGTLLDGVSYRGSDGKAKLWKFQFSEALRNDALNARNYFEYEGRNPLRRNQFSGKIGGPFVSGKVALFFGYDGIRARSERVVYEAVPADAFCRCGGGPVAPLLGGFLPEGTSIMPGDVSKDSAFLVARRRVRSKSDANALDGRLDLTRVLGLKTNFLTLRLTRQDADFLMPDGITGRNQRQGVTLTNGLAQFNIIRARYDHSFRFGINQTRSFSFTEVHPATDPSLKLALITVGSSVPVKNLPGSPETVPVATLGGLIGNSGGFDQTPTSFNASYDVRRFGSRHDLSGGFEVRFIRFTFDRFGGMAYSFADIPALRNGTAGTVTFLSDLSGASPFSGANKRRATQNYYLAYAQGQWRISSRSQLTYGVRYDYFGTPREDGNRAVVVDPQTGTILPPGSLFYRASRTNFQPRVGFTHQFENNFVLRAGGGIYSGAPKIGDLLLPIESDRFNIERKNLAFPTTPAEVIKDFVEKPDTREFRPFSFARDFTTPERIVKWDVMLTQTFGQVNDINVIYSGSYGWDLPVANIANPIISVQNHPDPTQTAIVRRQFDILTNGTLSKPFGELLYRTSKGHSSFQGLTFQFKRNNVPLGLSERAIDWKNFTSFNAQYTLGRNVGNVTGSVAASTLEFESDTGFNASDVRHVFSLSTGYRLWNDAAGRKRSDIAWGWTIAPTITARSGAPIIVRLTRPDVVYVDAAGQVFGSPGVGRQAIINTPLGGASGAARVPDLIPGANPYLRDGLKLLDPAAFAVPAPGQFGNLKRGEIRGQHSFQVDLAFTRELFHKEEIGGSAHIVDANLKIEVSNIFNRVNYSNPTASLPNVLGTGAAGDRIQPGVPFSRLTAGSTFGVINAADFGRRIQVTLNLKFNGF